MDFGFDADQQALRELAKKALANAQDPWAELARAGLTGVMLPVDDGGAGLSIVEQCLVFEQLGRAAAPAAMVPSLIAGAALALMDLPAREARSAVDGLDRVTLAWHEPGPATTIARHHQQWKLDGVKIAVAGLERATGVIVPARGSDGAIILARVPTDWRGLRSEAGVTTDDSTVHRLTFDGVLLDDAHVLTGPRAAELHAWIAQHLSVGFAAFELGIASKQLEMTAEYVVRRQQFGKPIGLFQAVGQRCADMHVDVESLRLATWEAAYLLATKTVAARATENVAGPATETVAARATENVATTIEAAVATAAFWAAEAGARVAAAAQHLHGGIGYDRAYPLYRYFLLAKRVELELGGATQQLARLGRLLAQETHA